MERPQYVQDAITIDEIGLHTGHYGPYRLNASYQPIFRVEDDMVVPSGVEALVRIHRDGQRVSPVSFFQNVVEKDQVFIESMCLALHVRNFHFLDLPDIDLFFNLNPSANKDLMIALKEIRYMKKRIGELGICPSRMICEITESSAYDSGTLRGIVKEFRRHGIRIAVDDYGTEFSNIERVETISPDIVKFDGDWFRYLANNSGAAKLVRTMVASFRNAGIQVLIEGIETEEQLAAAVDAGAHYVQGFLLAHPVTPASDFDWKPRPVVYRESPYSEMDQYQNVVQLHARG